MAVVTLHGLRMNNYEHIENDNSVIAFWWEDKRRESIANRLFFRGGKNPLAEEEAIKEDSFGSG